MEELKRIGMFFLLFITVMGALGTIGYLLYNKAFVILIGALAVDYWAAKPFIAAVRKLLGNE